VRVRGGVWWVAVGVYFRIFRGRAVYVQCCKLLRRLQKGKGFLSIFWAGGLEGVRLFVEALSCPV